MIFMIILNLKLFKKHSSFIEQATSVDQVSLQKK